MTFEDILDQVLAMLQRRGRVTYGTLQRQFALDAAALEDLKDALLYAYPQVVDENGRGLAWTGDVATTVPQSPEVAPPAPSVASGPVGSVHVPLGPSGRGGRVGQHRSPHRGLQRRRW